jgi:mitochondrial import receptor subunit TOM40
MQVATTGILSVTYHQKVSEKAGVAADFLLNSNAGESIAWVGYDYMFRNSRLRGTIDSHGKVAALLEEQLGPGIKLLLSGELDHFRQDHKFGFGMTVGE